jgi:hypothetical protein
MPPSSISNECFKVERAIESQMLRAGRWVLKIEKSRIFSSRGADCGTGSGTATRNVVERE